jgi:hypothetical protein
MKFYRAVNKPQGRYQLVVNKCKDKNGKFIRQEKEMLGQWVEHFTGLEQELRYGDRLIESSEKRRR